VKALAVEELERVQVQRMLDRTYQPTTIDPNKLLIGIAKTVIDGVDLGAIANAGVVITSTVKERYVGYPAQRHETVTESITAIASLTAEEIGSPIIIVLLKNLFANITKEYAVEMLAPQAGGGNLKLTAQAIMLPEVSLDWQDNWSNIQFKFEAVGVSAQTLLGRSLDTDPRSPATTLNTGYLSIGKPKVSINGQSVGSIQSVSLAMQGTTKKAESGYPRCTKGITILESKFEINLVAEEQIIQGNDVDVLLEQALVNGTVLRIHFPHCKVLEDLSLTTLNDWIGMQQKILPFKVDGNLLVEIL
jgi:hypothetical protein